MFIVFPFQNRGKEVLGSIFKGTTHATCLHSGGIKVFEEMFARLKNGNVDQSDGSDRRLAARHPCHVARFDLTEDFFRFIGKKMPSRILLVIASAGLRKTPR